MNASSGSDGAGTCSRRSSVATASSASSTATRSSASSAGSSKASRGAAAAGARRPDRARGAAWPASAATASTKAVEVGKRSSVDSCMARAKTARRASAPSSDNAGSWKPEAPLPDSRRPLSHSCAMAARAYWSAAGLMPWPSATSGAQYGRRTGGLTPTRSRMAAMPTPVSTVSSTDTTMSRRCRLPWAAPTAAAASIASASWRSRGSASAMLAGPYSRRATSSESPSMNGLTTYGSTSTTPVSMIGASARCAGRRSARVASAAATIATRSGGRPTRMTLTTTGSRVSPSSPRNTGPTLPAPI